MKVKQIMTSKVITISPNTSISEASSILFDKDLTGLPVIDKSGKLVGIITEYDLLSREDHIHIPSYLNFLSDFKKNAQPDLKNKISKIQNLKVSDLMTKKVITIKPTTSVAEAAQIFSERRINPLPVVDKNGVMVGIVSRSDIIKLFNI